MSYLPNFEPKNVKNLAPKSWNLARCLWKSELFLVPNAKSVQTIDPAGLLHSTKSSHDSKVIDGQRLQNEKIGVRCLISVWIRL